MQQGFSVLQFSFRGCNGEINNSHKSYHIGYTDDLLHLLTIINQRHPDVPLYLSGFSLGGNVILKLLGELGTDALKYNLQGAAVTSIPFDLTASQQKLDVGFNRFVYSEVSNSFNLNSNIHPFIHSFQ